MYRNHDPQIYLDFMGVKFDNYQPINNQLAWLAYFTKEHRQQAQFGIDSNEKILLHRSSGKDTRNLLKSNNFYLNVKLKVRD